MSPLRPPSHSLDPASTAFVVLLGLVIAMQAIGTTLTLPALPAIASDFETTPAVAQMTISVFLIGLACGQIITGALSDRFGRRPILIMGTMLFVVAGIGCTLAWSIEALIAMRMVQGFGAAAGMILGRAIVRDVFARERALRVMAGITGITTVVPMIGPPIAGLLLQFLSWRAIYALLTVISAALGILIYLCIAETLRAPDPRSTQPLQIVRNCLQMIRLPESISFVLITCLAYGGIFAFFTLLPFIALETFHLGTAGAGWCLGLSALAAWSGTRVNSRFSGRWPVRKILRLSMSLTLLGGLATLGAAMLVTYGLVNTTLGLPMLLAAMVLYGLGFGMTHPTSIVMALHPLPHIAGTAAALQASFQTLGGAAFAWLSAHLYNGTPAALGICVAIAGVTSFLVFALVAMKYAPATN